MDSMRQLPATMRLYELICKEVYLGLDILVSKISWSEAERHAGFDLVELRRSGYFGND
jgi:hypothetical protein